ncbi:MAG: Nudix family hydrolase, partial [Betaproteobacteria bacterium]|nr:Nudix family hydrolase [Betaproteobacteria bacterium]
GIRVGVSYPWLARVFAYPHATVRLNFRRVFEWEGDIHPRENQAVAWQNVGTPMREPMLPANAPILASLGLPVEYAVTDSTRFGLAQIEKRLRAGLKLLQVREPSLDEAARAAFTRKVIELAHRHGCKVMVKTPFAGADGVHYTASELVRITSRPEGLLAAASCHSREELERAMVLGLDFAVLGPVKPTPSHPGRSPLGWESFSRIVAGSTLPVYAIGGLSAEDLRTAWEAGAHGVALLSAAWRG